MAEGLRPNGCGPVHIQYVIQNYKAKKERFQWQRGELMRPTLWIETISPSENVYRVLAGHR